jgi:hypothetical protein
MFLFLAHADEISTVGSFLQLVGAGGDWNVQLSWDTLFGVSAVWTRVATALQRFVNLSNIFFDHSSHRSILRVPEEIQIQSTCLLYRCRDRLVGFGHPHSFRPQCCQHVFLMPCLANLEVLRSEPTTQYPEIYFDVITSITTKLTSLRKLEISMGVK